MPVFTLSFIGNLGASVYPVFPEVFGRHCLPRPSYCICSVWPVSLGLTTHVSGKYENIMFDLIDRKEIKIVRFANTIFLYIYVKLLIIIFYFRFIVLQIILFTLLSILLSPQTFLLPWVGREEAKE